MHITAYPPILLTHLATSLSTPPPPLSSPEKFWNVFLPVAGRTHDIEDLVFGSDGEGSAGAGEIVVEVFVRGSESSEGAVGRRKKSVERTLEGWICNRGVACELKDLPSLQNLFMSKSGFMEVRYIVLPFCTRFFMPLTRRNSLLLRQIQHKMSRSILHSLPSNSSQGRKFHYLTPTLVSIPLIQIFRIVLS